MHYAGGYLHNESVQDDDDAVFKALADPTRRLLLDRLRERNGQTLGELCGPLDMARQSATQHLAVLEAANLIATVRRGREKLHYLNPVPLWSISERVCGTGEEFPRLVDANAGQRMPDGRTFTRSGVIQPGLACTCSGAM